MKFPFIDAKSHKAVESALRASAPEAEFPPGLHDSTIRAVKLARREEIAVSQVGVLQRVAQLRWAPVTGFAALALFGIWLTVYDRSGQATACAPAIPAISTALTVSQEIADGLPSVTVGPLSDEWDKVNQDLNHTADFLLANLP
jgi:hypothetical protein